MTFTLPYRFLPLILCILSISSIHVRQYMTLVATSKFSDRPHPMPYGPYDTIATCTTVLELVPSLGLVVITKGPPESPPQVVVAGFVSIPKQIWSRGVVPPIASSCSLSHVVLFSTDSVVYMRFSGILPVWVSPQPRTVACLMLLVERSRESLAEGRPTGVTVKGAGVAKWRSAMSPYWVSSLYLGV
jgi:hypothetical protein